MGKDYYTKCNKCGHSVKSSIEFDKETKEQKWFIGGDGWTWDWEHDCSTREGLNK